MPTETKKIKSRPYRLGRNVFCVINCSDDYIEYLDKLLPHYEGAALAEEEMVEVRSGCSRFVGDVLGYVMPRNRHLGCAYVEATWVISPSGRSLLLAGKHGSGKTITALALALGHGWKVASDRYFLVDHKNRKLVAYNSPFSFQPDALELLQGAIGRVPALVLEPVDLLAQANWSPSADVSVDGEFDLKFDLAIYLDRVKASEMQVTPMSASEYLVRLMPQSNLFRSGASPLMIETLSAVRCLCISGGELEERLEVILSELASVTPDVNSAKAPAVTNASIQTSSAVR